MIDARLGLGPFRQRLPWLGGTLQTLRNPLIGRAPPSAGCRSERLVLPLSDGDRLHGALDRPLRPVAGRPLVLLAHGLAGTEDSLYMREASARLNARGHVVLRLNLRGAGPSRADCRGHYHAGRSDDLRQAIAALTPMLVPAGVVAMGFSLGGNTVLKLAGEAGAAAGRLRAVVALSAPIDLQATTLNLMRRRATLYQAVMMRQFKAEYVAPGAELSEALRAAAALATNFVRFDQTVTAPRHGYPSAAGFYAANGALDRLGQIRIPALVIMAEDDPVVPFAPYRRVDWAANPALYPVLTRRGGHVGFHGPEGIWWLAALERFLDHAIPG